MKPFWALPLLLSLTLPAAAASNASAQLFADTTAVQPGKTFTVAVVVTPTPGWHIYWTNPGDAGRPTAISFELPSGFTAGPVQLPLPERFLQPGGIVAYGYDHPTTFLATITPPANLPAGPVALRAKVSWLCCKEVCIPGHATLDLSLPTDATPAPDNAALFKKARALMPADHPSADLAPEPLPGRIGVRIHWKQPPASVEAFPFPSSTLELTDPEIRTQAADTHLSFAARTLAGQTPATNQLPVLVVYTTSDGKRAGFQATMELGMPLIGQH